MKKITFIFTLFLIQLGFSQNLLNNGDFSNGATSWNLDGGGTIVNGEAFYATTNAGGNPWDTQLAQSGMTFTAGTSYTLTFKARAAANRNITVAIQNVGSWDDQTPNQVYALTTTMQEFTQTFNAATSNSNVNLAFLLANQSGSTDAVWFDDIVLESEVSNPGQLELLLGFESSESGGVDGGPFGNGVVPVLEAGTGSNTSQVLKIVGNPSGEIWQGININLTNAANLTSTQTMSIDVKSSTPIAFLVKVLDGGPTAAAQVVHNGDGNWQTLNFTFNTSLDGQAALANGTYNKFVIHTYWADGATVFSGVTADNRTFYVDNIRGPLGIVIPDPIPSTPAPVPTTPNAEVYSIYNDTNNYTTTFPVAYSFGHLSGEPDLDESSTVNKAYKFNFGIAGWGQGEALANLTTYNFVSFDYWAQPNLPNGFRFVMISNNGGVTEHVYQIGTQEPLVTGEWKKVEIPLTYFTGLGFANTHFFQWKVSPFNDSVDNAGFVYVDNILITQNSVLSNNEFSVSNFSMYPNPANEVLNFNAKSNIQNIEVYNLMGQKVLANAFDDNQVSLNVSQLNSGVYVVKAIIDGVESSAKFIKK